MSGPVWQLYQRRPCLRRSREIRQPNSSYTAALMRNIDIMRHNTRVYKNYVKDLQSINREMAQLLKEIQSTIKTERRRL